MLNKVFAIESSSEIIKASKTQLVRYKVNHCSSMRLIVPKIHIQIERKRL